MFLSQGVMYTAFCCVQDFQLKQQWLCELPREALCALSSLVNIGETVLLVSLHRTQLQAEAKVFLWKCI